MERKVEAVAVAVAVARAAAELLTHWITQRCQLVLTSLSQKAEEKKMRCTFAKLKFTTPNCSGCPFENYSGAPQLKKLGVAATQPNGQCAASVQQLMGRGNSCGSALLSRALFAVCVCLSGCVQTQAFGWQIRWLDYKHGCGPIGRRH